MTTNIYTFSILKNQLPTYIFTNYSPISQLTLLYITIINTVYKQLIYYFNKIILLEKRENVSSTETAMISLLEHLLRYTEYNQFTHLFSDLSATIYTH